MNTLCSTLNCWSWPYRRLNETYFAMHERRQPRPPVRFCLEALEDRALLDANALGLATAALGGDVATLRKVAVTTA